MLAVEVFLPTTVGSKSTNMALGTCFPAPVSEKKVLKESSPAPIALSEGIWPSGCIPCSKQYSSQHALPIWAPAWPTWIERHSRMVLGLGIFGFVKNEECDMSRDVDCYTSNTQVVGCRQPATTRNQRFGRAGEARPGQ